MEEGLSGNLLQERVVDVLGDLLISSNLALNRTQEAEDLKVRVAKLEEELTTKTKTFTNRETAMYLELAAFVNLRRTPRRPFMTRAKRRLN